jgi:hypothetical protein
MMGWQESLVMTPKGYAYERVSCFWVSSWNKQILFLGMVDAASHFTALQLTASNLRNQFNVSMEYGWKISKVKLPTKDIYMIICGFLGCKHRKR